jgi:hypothetical protein
MFIVEAMAIVPLADGTDREFGVTFAFAAAALAACLSRIGQRSTCLSSLSSLSSFGWGVGSWFG